MKSTRNNPDPLSGILVVDKPSGWTSFDVVNKVRKMLHGVKVGHTGTLDPQATGVLVLLIGSATKLAPGFESDTKRYWAEVTFGRATDTYDAEGVTTAEGDSSLVDREQLRDAIRSLSGESEQLPPMYSAVKIGGRKLYDLARAGKTVERTPRPITISSIEASLEDFPRVILDIECSKGTYIRSIAQQLGEMAGCPAHLSALRRTVSGKFRIEDAIEFASVAQSGAAEELMGKIIPVSGPAVSI
jgi:tRNA pseudouridine55 synthase